MLMHRPITSISISYPHHLSLLQPANPKDFYGLLGVGRAASAAELRQVCAPDLPVSQFPENKNVKLTSGTRLY